MTVVGGEKFDIGANPAEGGGEEDEGVEDTTERKIDIVAAFRLVETGFDKKGFMGYIKQYMKKVKEYLEANKPNRVDVFMKNIQPFVKDVLSNFDDYKFWLTESMDPENLVIISKYDEGKESR